MPASDIDSQTSRYIQNLWLNTALEVSPDVWEPIVIDARTNAAPRNSVWWSEVAPQIVEEVHLRKKDNVSNIQIMFSKEKNLGQL